MNIPKLIESWSVKYQVYCSQVVVVVINDKYADIYLDDGRKIVTRHLLHEIQEKWPDCLVFCHRSYVVNPYHVKEWDKSKHQLTLCNGMVIPVARRKVKEFNERWDVLVG